MVTFFCWPYIFLFLIFLTFSTYFFLMTAAPPLCAVFTKNTQRLELQNCEKNNRNFPTLIKFGNLLFTYCVLTLLHKGCSTSFSIKLGSSNFSLVLPVTMKSQNLVKMLSKKLRTIHPSIDRTPSRHDTKMYQIIITNLILVVTVGGHLKAYKRP